MKQELNLLDGYTPTNDLLNDAKQIIEVSQKAAYRAVNLALVQRNWLLGYRIAQEELKGEERSEYGKGIIKKLADSMCNNAGMEITDDACKYILEYFENKTHQRINDFGNGRGVRNYFERLLLCQANRLALLDTVNRNDIRTLTIEDAIGASNE